MSMAAAAVMGITAVMLAVSLKSIKSEYGVLLILAAGFIIFSYGIGKMASMVEVLEEVRKYIQIEPVYFQVLLKMIGMTYLAEFASGICKDSGYGALGTQIEIFGKLSVLAVSMPVVLILMETLETFLPS